MTADTVERLVTVKPLEWRDAKLGNNSVRQEADTFFWRYEVLRWSSGKFGGTLPSPDDDGTSVEYSDCDSLDDAKAAAQDDYERRILSALQPPTVAEAARVLLSDDISLSKMAEAMHDGPLLAGDYEYRADTKAGGWCLDCIREALRALTKEGDAG